MTELQAAELIKILHDLLQIVGFVSGAIIADIVVLKWLREGK
jgi:hypothetical protein